MIHQVHQVTPVVSFLPYCSTLRHWFAFSLEIQWPPWNSPRQTHTKPIACYLVPTTITTTTSTGTIPIITTYAMAWQCLNNSLAKKRVWEKWSAQLTDAWWGASFTFHQVPLIPYLTKACAIMLHNTTQCHLFSCCTPIWDFLFLVFSFQAEQQMYRTYIFRLWEMRCRWEIEK